MRSGCLNLVFVLVAASVATVLTAVGVVLFFSALLPLESSTGVETILETLVALIAAYFFVRVGLSVWRDLRGHRPTERSEEGKEERGPVAPGGR
jgi:hypothetical protein